MLLFALASAGAPMHAQLDALAAANAAAADAIAAASGAAVAPLATAGEQAACPGYTSLTNQPEDDAINDWCQVQCPGFCPVDKCMCITDAPKRREEPAAGNEPGAAATAAPYVDLDPAEQRKALHTELPRTIPDRISGPWFYVTDGNTREPTGHERNSLYGDFDGAGKEIGFGSAAGRKLPDWLASANRSGNAITLAFMNPTELGDAEFGVPPAFIEYTHLLRQGPENRDRQIYFAIGGMEFNGYDFLADMALAEAAGQNACGAARAHNVGIEIDHEGTKGNDVEGLKSFVRGFRKKCPMGQYPISMDLMGGPGGGALFWAPEAVKALLPPGKPTDPPPDGDEPYLDFVNIMVIGACQDSACLSPVLEAVGRARLHNQLRAHRLHLHGRADLRRRGEPDDPRGVGVDQGEERVRPAHVVGRSSHGEWPRPVEGRVQRHRRPRPSGHVRDRRCGVRGAEDARA